MRRARFLFVVALVGFGAGCLDVIGYRDAIYENATGGGGATSTGAGGTNTRGGTGGSESSCNDGKKNGEETDADCGGTECDPCSAQEGCATGPDCESTVC